MVGKGLFHCFGWLKADFVHPLIPRAFGQCLPMLTYLGGVQVRGLEKPLRAFQSGKKELSLTKKQNEKWELTQVFFRETGRFMDGF